MAYSRGERACPECGSIACPANDKVKGRRIYGCSNSACGHIFYRYKGKTVTIDHRPWMELEVHADLSTLQVHAYTLVPSDPYDHDIPVLLERVGQLRGPDKWAIRRGHWCFTKDKEFALEPIPSSRTDAFLQWARWDTAEEAYAAWLAAGSPKR